MISKAVLDKIKKCLALAKIANEHEAAAALTKARELMDAYNVTQDDVELSDIEERRARASAAMRPPLWENMLCASVRHALGVSVFLDGSDRVYIGPSPAAEIASYAFGVLYRRLKAARREYIATALKRCKLARKRARADAFCEGWARSVYSKIKQLMPAKPESELIGRYLEEKHPGLVTSNSRAAKLDGRSYNDFQRGVQRGRSVDLQIGLGASGSPQAVLS